jgi:hypothetical protein
MFEAVVSNEDIDEQACAAIASRIKADLRLFSEALAAVPAHKRPRTWMQE